MTSFEALIVLALIVHVCSTSQSHPLVLVVSFDGFRYDYLNSTSTPWMNALRLNGISVPYMEPVFPTETFPNHQSIATGVYPEVHGVIHNFVYDPLYNRTMTGFNEDPQYWNYNPEALPLWILNQLAGDGRHSGCYMWPGGSVRYGWHHDILPTYNVTPVYNESVSWNDRVDTVMDWMTDPTKPANLVYMYYSQPDGDLHLFGPNSRQREERVVEIDNHVGYLVQKLIQFDLYEKTNLILLSDHGTEEFTLEKVIPLIAFLNGTNSIDKIRGGDDLLHVTVKDGMLEEAYAKIKEFSNHYNFTVLKKSQLKAPFYHRATRRNADLTIVADPGYVFDDMVAKYSKGNGTGKYGTHGYINTWPTMRPFFVAHGPAFRKAYFHRSFKSVDLFPLLGKILGLTPTESNGSLSNVGDMLRNNNSYANSASSLLNGWNSLSNCVLSLVIALCKIPMNFR